DVVDMGSTTVVATDFTTYELTVNRGSRTDTCSVAHTRPGGSSSSSGGIGGGTPQILGEQVSAVPLGAPNTGLGGASSSWPQWAALVSFLLIVAGLGYVRRRS
ncbi:MAG TPA: hypothetical protein VKP88_01735, partial [Candidatus Paceibacterota bacterium]|nr:hypothetical protein [Candidatus Paceibacterota bacterium]